MALLRKVKSILGLDIGVSSVKIIELIVTPKGISLVNLGTAPIVVPADAKEEDAKQKAIVKAINNIISEKKIKTRRTITGLLGQSVFIRMVNLPKSVLMKMKKDQIIGMLKTEIEAEIPFSLEEAAIDFFYLGELDEDKVRKYRITVVVVPQTAIQENIAIIQQAGLKPVIIDTATFALCRAYRRLVKEEDLVKTVAVIEISATSTEVNIIQEGSLQLTRSINLGGNNLTKAISDTLQIPAEEAEKKKREEDVIQAITPQLEKITEEIKSSFKYYQFQMHQQVEKVMLCGGGAKVKKILEFFQEKIALPVEYLTPFKDIKYDPKIITPELLQDLEPSLSICVGLALRDIKEAKAVNFLPPELWERSFVARRPFLVEGLALGFIVAVLFAGFGLKLKGLTGKYNDARMLLDNLAPKEILAKASEIKVKKAKIDADMEILKKLAEEKTTYSQIMKNIVDGLPPNLWLNNFALGTEEITTFVDDKSKGGKKDKRAVQTTQQLTLKMTGSSGNTQEVALFMLYLKNSPAFKEVNLINLQQATIGEVLIMNFIVECTLK
ncbi:MAG: type IV pilus assembly protein PilM [bacterium]